MNKKGIQANQSAVVWSVAIGVLVLLIAMFAITNSAKNSVNSAVGELGTSIDSSLSGAVSELRSTAAGLDDIQLPTFDTGQLDEICSETDGCGGKWDVPSAFRAALAARVVDELEESDSRDLFREIKNLVDVDDKEDITDVFVDSIGEVRTNQDPNRGFTETREVTVDMIVEVEYFEDGDNDDTKTKHFRVKATIDELEDGIGDSEVTINSVEKVSSRFVLPGN